MQQPLQKLAPKKLALQRLALWAVALAALPLSFGAWAIANPPDPDQDQVDEGQVDEGQGLVEQAFAANGIRLDLTAGVVAVPALVEVRDDLLEYLAVLPNGAAHESLFVLGAELEPSTLDAWTRSLNAALLALGVTPGKNAEWVEKDPRPSEQELRDGVSPYDVLPPRGDGLYLYAAWYEGDELFFYRMEDLVRDLDRRRTLRRHRWVYLGSRMITRKSGEESFAAALEGNLINISFFAQGNTLLTGGLRECLGQTRWLPNAWLLPERGESVTLIFSRERLDSLPAVLRGDLPRRVGGER